MTPRPRPSLAGVPPAAADTFVRARVLALRASPRRPDHVGVVPAGAVTGDPRRTTETAGWSAVRPLPRGARGHGLRTDVVAHLLLAAGRGAGGGGLVVVRTREGPAEELTDDVDWARAVASGAALVGRATPPLLVVTRWGWRTHPDGLSRTWQRLRTG